MHSILYFAALIAFSVVVLRCSGHVDDGDNGGSRRWETREYNGKHRRGEEDSEESSRRSDKEERQRPYRRREKSDEDNEDNRSEAVKRRRGQYDEDRKRPNRRPENSEENDQKKQRRRGQNNEKEERPDRRPENSGDEDSKSGRRGKNEERRPGRRPENSEEDEGNDRYNKKDRRRGQKEGKRSGRRPENSEEDDDDNGYNKKNRKRGQNKETRPGRRSENSEEEEEEDDDDDDERKKGRKKSRSEAGKRRGSSRRGENSDEKAGRNRPRHENEDDDEERRPARRGQKTSRRSFPKCPEWNDTFEESKCLWPGPNFHASIPEICSPIHNVKNLPPLVGEYYKSKATEFIDVLANLFKQRGIAKPCGRCSLKLACRKRVSSSKQLVKNAFCKPVDVLFNSEDCDGPEPCQVSMVNGGCPAPVPRPPVVPLNHPLLRDVKYQISSFWAYKYGRDMSDDDSEDRRRGKGEKGCSHNPAVCKLRDAEEGEREGKNSTEIVKSIKSGFNESAESEETPRKNFTPSFPLWHCVKNADGRSCLCCCGDYFPDAKTRKCVKVKEGNIYPPINF